MYEKTRFDSGVLVRAAEEHGVRTLTDELELVEVGDQRVHRQGQDALAR